MIAWISPAWTSRLTWSVAVSPPKRLTRPVTRSSGSAMTAAPQQTEDAALGEEDREDHQRAQDDQPMAGEGRQLVLEDEIDRGAKHRAEERADAAQDHHDHDLAGAAPMHDRRRDKQQLV